MNSTDQSIVIELNEINFDIVQRYIDQGANLPAFKHLLQEFDRVDTFADVTYDQLEPWIQWVSVHTGLPYKQHGVFRLGDGIHLSQNTQQIFEVIEGRGQTVAAFSPMNAANRLHHPLVFVPDPWTGTPADSSAFSNRLSNMLKQTVNQNAAGRVSLRSYLTLIEAMIKTKSLSVFKAIFTLVVKSVKRTWYRSLVLDTLLCGLHMRYFKSLRPNVSFLFLNAGAHIQHHYLHNSSVVDSSITNPDWYVGVGEDPVLDMLKVYDNQIMNYLHLAVDSKLALITGLSQVPYDTEKYYYRLRNHEDFFRVSGINYEAINPRMTRDFEIVFRSNKDKEKALDLISNAHVVSTGEKFFGDIEVRDRSLFVTLTYPREITSDLKLEINGKTLTNLNDDCVFVALKNGKHTGKGYAFFSKNWSVDPTIKNNSILVEQLYDVLLSGFS